MQLWRCASCNHVFTPADIAALEAEHGITLPPEGSGAESITGHIDFLQVRNGAVHILDYRPAPGPTSRSRSS